MKTTLTTMLSTLALAGALCGPAAHAQEGADTPRPKPAPVIIKFSSHATHASDFTAKMSKDAGLRQAVQSKGIDVAFTEWMQRDHPSVFRNVCLKEAGAIAREYKSTNHMLEFDKLLEKRSDLRALANKRGHDFALAEWLRKEHPDLYRQHFGLDANNRPLKGEDKTDHMDKGN